MTGADHPYLPRGVRLHHDRVRDVPVLLGPEIALILDPVGQAVLTELDGVRDVSTISTCLAQRYDAPLDEVQSDVIEFLSGMADRQLVALA